MFNIYKFGKFIKNLSEDFYYNYDHEAYPDFQKELSFFSRNPKNPKERLTIDMLLDFTLFDEVTSTAVLEKGLIKIKKLEQEFIILENDKEIANIYDEVDLDLPSELLTKLPSHSPTILFSSKNPKKEVHSNNTKDNKRSSFMEFLSADEDFFENHKQFIPPEFGVTVLGCSHGFDPKGSTSGYVFWINGRFFSLKV